MLIRALRRGAPTRPALRNIGDGFGGRFAYSVTRQRGTIAGMLFRRVENLAGFGIFVPFAFGVLLGHKTLLAHEEQIEAPAALARASHNAKSSVRPVPRMASPMPVKTTCL